MQYRERKLNSLLYKILITTFLSIIIYIWITGWTLIKIGMSTNKRIDQEKFRADSSTINYEKYFETSENSRQTEKQLIVK